MKNLLIAMTFLTVSCGMNVKKITKYNVDPSLQPFVSTYQSKMSDAGKNKKINDLEVHFSDNLGSSQPGSLTIGVCIRSTKTVNKGYYSELYETPVIKINKTWWDRSTTTEADREEVMNHELTHCILGRDHTETIIANENRPASIMYPYHLGEYLYTTHYPEYMAELFGAPAVAFQSARFDPTEYASTVIDNPDYIAVVEDDSHLTNCVHDLAPVIIDETPVENQDQAE